MLTDAFLSQLLCEIILPDDHTSGKLNPQIFDPSDDRRRFPRIQCHADGILQYQSTFPTLRRSNACHRVVIQEISRSSIRFLHAQEMFPEEHARFIFMNSQERQLAIKRCCRLGPKCYLVGAEFDELLNDLTEGQWR